jgi:hypothetical protein
MRARIVFPTTVPQAPAREKRRARFSCGEYFSTPPPLLRHKRFSYPVNVEERYIEEDSDMWFVG